MHAAKQFFKLSPWATVIACSILVGAYSSSALSAEVRVLLAGNQEVPPVVSPASGSASFMVGADKSISGSVSTLSLAGTAAHIHEGTVSSNGPVIIPLTATSATVWTVPAGSVLTDAQYESYKNGRLYVNVHSAANKGGEIRGQLIP